MEDMMRNILKAKNYFLKNSSYHAKQRMEEKVTLSKQELIDDMMDGIDTIQYCKEHGDYRVIGTAYVYNFGLNGTLITIYKKDVDDLISRAIYHDFIDIDVEFFLAILADRIETNQSIIDKCVSN